MESSDNSCLVCHEHTEIWAIGQCDHPICFKCSTRMRALCDQFYCPICRTDLPEVFFFKTREKFGQMPVMKFITNRRLKIQFENDEVRECFEQLLEHRCTLCKDRYPERNFKALRDHIRRVHQMFFCDLCLELKIFTSERKVYCRQDLATHRRVGDKDDKSYKGHPLCQFCDQRYLDKDELYKHLRKDHFFCHFCESLGTQEFYNDYDSLRDHFLTEHYLCEEGECAKAQFTNAFRSDIDLKSHQASQHSKAQTKQQARQERTINIDINFVPRPNSRPHRGDVDGRQKGAPRHQAYRGGRGNRYNDFTSSREKQDIERAIQASLNTMREEDMNKERSKDKPDSSSSDEDFTHTEKNFPALETTQPLSTAASSAISNAATDSKPSLADRLALSNNMSVQHGQLNDFPTLTSAGTRSDSPVQPLLSLASNVTHGAKKLDDEFPELTPKFKAVPVVHGTWDRLKKTESNKPSPHKHKKEIHSKHDLSAVNEFPSLGESANSSLNKQWLKTSAKSQVQEESVKGIENNVNTVIDRFSPTNISDSFKLEKNKTKKKKKEKVTKIKHENERTGVKGNSSLDDIAGFLMSSCSTEDKTKQEESKQESEASGKQIASRKKEDKIEKRMENEKKEPRKQKTDYEIEMLHLVEETHNENEEEGTGRKGGVKFLASDDDFPALGTVSQMKKPPPGFQQAEGLVLTKAPPGFTNVAPRHPVPPGFTPQSLSGKQNSDLGSNSSPPENIPLFTDDGIFKYSQPADFMKRNQMLINTIQSLFDDNSTEFVHFKNLSRDFRCSDIDATQYYSRCEDLLGRKNFENIFAELLALLPDIGKQQDLLYEHLKNMHEEDELSKGSEKGQNGKGAWMQAQSGFLTCPTCRQVLVRKDYNSHLSSHSLDSDFPVLGRAQVPSQKIGVSGTWVKAT